jgi:hypothetical protein
MRWTKDPYIGDVKVKSEAEESLRDENEKMKKMITDFMRHNSPDQYNPTRFMGLSAVFLFEQYLEDLKYRREQRAEEARVRAHVENILKEKGLTNPPSSESR